MIQAEEDSTGAPSVEVPSPPQMTGWLTKEGAKWKTWRKRWFVLQSPYLRYYKHDSDKDPLGSIDLQSCGHIRGVQYKKARFTFQIQTPSRTYFMCGESADDRDKWVDALNSALSALHPVTLKCAVQLSDFESVSVVKKIDQYEKLVQARLRDDTSMTFIMRFIDRKDTATNDWIEKFASEIIVLQNLDHPFVENLRYFFQTPEKFCFVEDDIHGTPLSVVIQRGGALPFDLVQFLAAEICLGLEHLHCAGIMYPVLSPDNVIITEDGHSCLKSKDKLAAPCRKEYRAPELYAGAPYTPAHDWWCYGCLLFELLTTKSPFRGDSEEEMKYSVMNDPVLLPSTVPQEGRNFIAKLLDRRPEKRLSEASLIKRQEIFETIDMEMLYKKQITPPADMKSINAVIGNKQIPSTPPGSETSDSFANFTFVAERREDSSTHTESSLPSGPTLTSGTGTSDPVQ